MAKQLLADHNVSFYDCSLQEWGDERFQEMKALSQGKRTVPQIFVGSLYIGGYQDLQNLFEVRPSFPRISVPPRKMAKANNPEKTIRARYFMGILATNIKVKAVRNTSAAVEKFAGRINPQIPTMAKVSLPNTSLRSLILFWFTDKILAMYMTRAILAKSEV